MENDDLWENNRNSLINFYKCKSRRHSSNDRYESGQSDDGEIKMNSRQQSPYGGDSTIEQSQNSEAEEECNQRTNVDNNNHCKNSYLLKSKYECSLSYTKNDDSRTVVVNRQEIQTNKPILKFSVNAILGSDHGKSSFKPGK